MTIPPSTFHLPPSNSNLKVAIVCDWLIGIGGAERVVLELHRLFPDAPIYTSQYDPKKIGWFKDADVRTTWLQKLPSGLKKFLPVLRAWTFSRLDLRDYDLIISTSGAEAKFVKRLKEGAKHIAYTNAPIHYYWSRYDEYMKHPGFGIFDPLARLGLKLLVGPMRRWDYKAAQRPDHMIAISTHIQKEIQKYYGRDSVIIHPPVDVERFHLPPSTFHLPKQGFITAGRQTPYKRIDLAVTACTKLNLPLTVIGNGPEHYKLVKIAGPSITFKTNVSDSEMPQYFQSAKAFIFPGLDDFGITPVEAMAAGTPVIAYEKGGALDYVVPGKTGEFFTKQSVESLAHALQIFNGDQFDERVLAEKAASFNTEIFRNNISGLINNNMVY